MDSVLEQKLDQLQNLLEMEMEYVSNENWSELQTCNEDKQVLIQQVEQAASQLQQTMPDALRHKLLKLQNQNDINGRIIHRKNATTERLLSLIKQQPQQSSTYSANGKATKAYSAGQHVAI